MTDPEKRALTMLLQSTRTSIIFTFLHELATNEATLATQTLNRDEAFAHSQRAAGLFKAHQQLGEYARTELRNDDNG